MGSPLKGSNNNQFGAVNPSEAQYANPTHACLAQGSYSHIQSGGQQGVRKSYAGAVRNSVRPQSAANSKTGIPSSPVDLDLFQPCFENGRLMVKPPKDVVAEGCVLWGNTLVGQFVGQRLHYQAVHSIAHKIWGNMGLEEVLSTESGFFFFKFSSEDDLSAVLDRAPWHMANRPLVLKRWHQDMTLLKEEQQKIPLWVRLLRKST
jgi:hypothetical protein